MAKREEAPSIRAFAVDPTTYLYRCTGCKAQSRSAFDKAGVEHFGMVWNGGPIPEGKKQHGSDPREYVCGTWELVKVEPPGSWR